LAADGEAVSPGARARGGVRRVAATDAKIEPIAAQTVLLPSRQLNRAPRRHKEHSMLRHIMIPAGALAAAFLAAPTAASAQARLDPSLSPSVSTARGGDMIVDAQYRRGVRPYRGGGYRYGYRPGYRYGYRPGYRYRYGNGAAVGAITGLAAGAIIGGALANSANQPVYAAPGGNAVAYCMQRFKSYDPASGTYLGYDGLRHPCP
jgi:hypothetical protein